MSLIHTNKHNFFVIDNSKNHQNIADIMEMWNEILTYTLINNKNGCLNLKHLWFSLSKNLKKSRKKFLQNSGLFKV